MIFLAHRMLLSGCWLFIMAEIFVVVRSVGIVEKDRNVLQFDNLSH